MRRPVQIAIALALMTAVFFWVKTTSKDADNRELRYRYIGADVSLYAPKGDPLSFAIIVVDKADASLALPIINKLLSSKIAVAVVPLASLNLAKMTDKTQCLDFAKTLHLISNDAQHRLSFPIYRVPFLVGTGEGALAAFLGYRQTGAGMWSGVLTIDRTQQIALSRPPCYGWGAEVAGSGLYTIMISHRSEEIWIDLPDLADTRLDDAVAKLVAARPIQGGIEDLPLTIVKPKDSAADAPLAILYSGDGGWAGLDRKIATELANRGIETIGVSSLEYFWKERRPAEAAADLQRIIDSYAGDRKLMLNGYSYGADVLPFIFAALKPETQARVMRINLLGLSKTADFEFHLSNWVDVPSNEAKPTVPMIESLSGVQIHCIRGQLEVESACKAIANHKVSQFLLPGDHHFNSDAKRVVAAFLDDPPSS